MKKAILLLSICFVLAMTQADPDTGTGSVSSTDYCSGVSWNTLTDFYIDFDHTTDNKTACGADEIGTLTDATIADPSVANPGSDGDALHITAANDGLSFDNTGSYVDPDGTYGEIYFLWRQADSGTGNTDVFTLGPDLNANYILVYITSVDALRVQWEDNNAGSIQLTIVDLTSYLGDWIQVHIKWDTERCTDGTCDGAGEDELCGRYRIDDNQDGDFNDGGIEDWSSLVCETTAQDMENWGATMGADDVRIGYGAFASFTVTSADIDDFEISPSKPSW